MDELVRQLTHETSFSISGHHLEIFGVCPGCQQTPMARHATP
jgi:Fe2+ or Zn2+ uptake regulation protein